MLNTLKKTVASAGICMALICGLPAQVMAQSGPITAEEDAANRVNISGRQRMLSQRMAKSACFVSLGLDQDKYVQQLEKARSEFALALFALRFGDADRRMLPPKSPDVAAAFAPVSEVWLPFADAVQAALANPQDKEALSQISTTNLLLLKTSNDAVTVMADTYGGGSISADLANTINVAGRQRMLSQRMAKGMCEALRNPASAAASEDFLASFDLFATSHAALLSGDPAANIVAPPSSEVQLQLLLVDEIWAEIRDELILVASGVPPTEEMVTRLGIYSDRLLVEMNIAVGAYGKAANASS